MIRRGMEEMNHLYRESDCFWLSVAATCLLEFFSFYSHLKMLGDSQLQSVSKLTSVFLPAMMTSIK